MLESFTVNILAGGKGTRLSSVVKDRPKPMALIGDVPFLEIVLEYWKKLSPKRFILSLGYMPDLIVQHFGSHYKNIPITYIVENEPLGTGGAVKRMLDEVELDTDYLIVANGDTWCPMTKNNLQNIFLKRPQFLVVLKEVTTCERYGSFEVDNNNIIAFREPHNGSGFINIGCYVLSAKSAHNLFLSMGEKFSLESEFFPKVISLKKVSFEITNEVFIDIGIPLDYKKAQSLNYNFEI